MLIKQDKTNLKYILIVVLAVIVGGGILAFQYLVLSKEEVKPPEIKTPKIETPIDQNAKEDERVTKKSGTESQCQIILKKGVTDKTRREQLYPTTEGESKISLKFKEGSEVRLRKGKFISLCGENLSQINNLINNYPNISIQRLFSRSEEDLAEEYNKLKQNNPDIADLNLWYRIILPEDASVETVDSLINKLNEFYIIEIAYPEPLPAPHP